MIAITALVLVLILTLATLIVWASDVSSSSKLLSVVLLALLAFLSMSTIVLARGWFFSRLMLVILLLSALAAADLVLQLTSKEKARAWAKWTVVALSTLASLAVIVQIGNPSRQADSDSGSGFGDNNSHASRLTDNISRIPQASGPVTQPIPIPYVRQADRDSGSEFRFGDNDSPQPSLPRDGMRQNRDNGALLQELGSDNTESYSNKHWDFTNETGPFALSLPSSDEHPRSRQLARSLGRSW